MTDAARSFHDLLGTVDVALANGRPAGETFTDEL